MGCKSESDYSPPRCGIRARMYGLFIADLLPIQPTIFGPTRTLFFVALQEIAVHAQSLISIGIVFLEGLPEFRTAPSPFSFAIYGDNVVKGQKDPPVVPTARTFPAIHVEELFVQTLKNELPGFIELLWVFVVSFSLQGVTAITTSPRQPIRVGWVLAKIGCGLFLPAVFARLGFHFLDSTKIEPSNPFAASLGIPRCGMRARIYGLFIADLFIC